MFGCHHRNDFPWLSLSLECCIMVDTLIMLVEEKDGKTGTWRQKRRAKRGDAPENPDQSLLFPVSIEERERFDKLARTFELAINPKRRSSVWDIDWKLEFFKYEIFGFMEHWKKAEVESMIEPMLAISRGEPLEDEVLEKLIKFLGQVQMWALGETRGGCC